MKNYKKNTSGIILIEALISIGILVICTSVAGTLINSGVRWMVFSKNYIVAQNFAVEAFEVVNNVRDTNWLVQADDPGCWLELEPDDSPGCAFKVEVGNHYIPEEVAGGGWKLTQAPGSGALDLSDSIPDDGFRLDTDSIFYRGINVMSLVDSEPDGIDDYAEFEVVVEWMEGRVIRSIRQPFVLYNHPQ